MTINFSELRNDFGSDLTKFVPFGQSLIGVQKTSYENFLGISPSGERLTTKPEGSTLESVFKSVFPIEDPFGGQQRLDFVSYRLVEPRFTIEECRVKGLTYGYDLIITVALTTFHVDENTGVAEVRSIKEQEVPICQIPKMTSNATFIVAGCEKVVVMQVARSPGLMVTRDLDEGSPIYSATIRAARGSSLMFSFDGKSALKVGIDRKRKLPVYHILTAFGMKVQEMIDFYYKKLDVSLDKETGMLGLHLLVDEMVGRNIPFDILSKDGRLLCEKGVMITRGIVRKLKAENGYYCTKEVFTEANFVLAEDVSIHGEVVYETASIVSSSMLASCIKNEIATIRVVDIATSDYSPVILSSILSNKKLSYSDVMLAVFKTVKQGEPFSIEVAEEKFKQTFCSPSFYDLLPVGRYKLNQALQTDVPDSNTTLLPQDVFLTIKKLIELKESGAETDDIDSLANRRLRCVGELVESQVRKGCVRLVRVAREKLRSGAMEQALPINIINGASVAKEVRAFFGTSQLTQYMDQTNPLAELSHSRRISALGPGGVSLDRAVAGMRDVHVTHYGRMCSTETPEGKNIGLVNSLASLATVDKYGFIQTPYRRVIDGVIQQEVVYLDVATEAKHVVCQYDKNIIDGNKIIVDMVSARKDGNFAMVETSEVDFIDVTPSQTISVVAGAIPFIENDNVNRALTGSNMQKQAVPLISTEAPMVGTGIESYVAKESGAVIRASRSGQVVYTDASNICIRVVGQDGQLGSDMDTYSLRKFKKSNSGTCVNQMPIVGIGDMVVAGDVIADGPATKNGEIALGRNLRVAFLVWRGYNFEDAIVVSEKVVNEGLFTSVHIEEFEVTVRDTRLGVEQVTRDIPNVSADATSHLDECGIVQTGTFVKPGMILVGKLTPKTGAPVTPEERLLMSILGERVSETRDTSTRVPPGIYGTIVGVEELTKRGLAKSPRAKQIEQEQIALIERNHNRESESVRRFFADEVIDVLVGKEVKLKSASSKKGVIVDGQILTKDLADKLTTSEVLSLKCNDAISKKKLDKVISQYEMVVEKMQSTKNTKIENCLDGDDLQPGVLKTITVRVAIKSRLELGDKMAGRHGNKGVVSRIVPVEDMPYMEDGTPVDMVLNPLGVPSRMNIGQILETHLGMVGHLVGQRMKDFAEERESSEGLRKFLGTVLTDKKLLDRFDKMSNEQLKDAAEKCKNGFPFATPSFEAVKSSGIEEMLEACDFPRSGQVDLYDGVTGRKFDRKVTVGFMYILKLHHLAHAKIHARSTGAYSLVTQQPLSGKAQFGGQKLGEMEVWALQAYGAAYCLREMLTYKSDDVVGRNSMYEAIVKGNLNAKLGTPESMNVMLNEVRSLALNLQLHKGE